MLTLTDDEHTELRRLLNLELAPYLGEQSARVIIEGDGLALAREPAIAMEMVFHELVTNAIKYGALSNETGRITARWHQFSRPDGDRARVEWIESGGPAIKADGKPGFGTMLIQSSVSHDLAGTVIMQFEPQGLHCTIEFPIIKRTTDARKNTTGT